MTSSTFEQPGRAWRAAFFLSLAGVIAWLCLRGYGLYPAVFADEWYYSKMSRLIPLAESLLPSYLYLWLFSATSACGDGFLECARAGNIALYCAALPFVYLVARRFTEQGYAWLLTLLAAAAPLNVYTMYFMPEASYWFGFSVLSWVVLARDAWPLHVHALAGGLVLGLMSQIKVHALFLVPALCLYLLYAAWLQGGAPARWLGRGVLAAGLAAAATLALKFGLGWLLAGDAGLSLLGPFYQSTVSTGSKTTFAALAAPIVVSAFGHLMALAVLYGIPLAILLQALACGGLGRQATPANRLLAWVLLTLGAGLGLTVVYTASLAGRDAVEGVRLHLRYYSFMFPLIWLVAAASLRAPLGPRVQRDGRRLRWAIAAIFILLVLIAFNSLPTYAPSVIDGPDIGSVNLRRTSGHVTVVLQLALLAVWASGRWNAARLFVLVMLPVLVLIGQDRIAGSASAHRESNLGDRAAALVIGTLPAAERGRIALAGADELVPQIMRAQFHIDRADTVMLVLAPGAPVPEERVPPGYPWLLVMGQHAAPFASVVRQTGEFTLLRLPDPGRPFLRANLATPLAGGEITAIEGLSGIEPWGRWSDAKQVVFHFSRPLPRRVDLLLSARAFGSNTELPFTLRAGDQAKTFRLGSGTSQLRLQLETDGMQRSLAIEVPKPESPRDTGASSDARMLGIGISELVMSETVMPSGAAR